MTKKKAKPPYCSTHGRPTHRAACPSCNAAYMRGYLRRRREEAPGWSIWERARGRARRYGIAFTLSRDSIAIPQKCPALGIRLVIGGSRSVHSPSLDRIDPALGYVSGNVRVLSDHANRLKSNWSLTELRRRAHSGPRHLREDYAKVAEYVERELLLAEVRAKAEDGGTMGPEWEKIASFLERAFVRADWKSENG